MDARIDRTCGADGSARCQRRVRQRPVSAVVPALGLLRAGLVRLRQLRAVHGDRPWPGRLMHRECRAAVAAPAATAEGQSQRAAAATIRRLALALIASATAGGRGSVPRSAFAELANPAGFCSSFRWD